MQEDAGRKASRRAVHHCVALQQTARGTGYCAAGAALPGSGYSSVTPGSVSSEVSRMIFTNSAR